MPVLLGGVFKLTNNRSPRESFAGIKNKMEYRELEMQRFISRHHIKNFQMNPFFPVNTLTMMRSAVAAQTFGVFSRYVDEMFCCMWSEPKKMDDPAIWQRALHDAGFEAEKFAELVQSRAVKEPLLANTARSVERGTFGSPTFLVGDEIYFGKYPLTEVEDAIRSPT